jgi:hypothetical protein
MKTNVSDLARLTDQSALKLIKGFYRFDSSASIIFRPDLDLDEFIASVEEYKPKVFLTIDNKSIIAELVITTECLADSTAPPGMPDTETHKLLLYFDTEFGKLIISLLPDADTGDEWGEFVALYETGMFAS